MRRNPHAVPSTPVRWMLLLLSTALLSACAPRLQPMPDDLPSTTAVPLAAASPVVPAASAAPPSVPVSAPTSIEPPAEPLLDELPVTANDHRPAGVGVHHVVMRGQTLYRIALTYGVPLQQLAEVNDIDDPARIVAGQRLWVPGAARLLEVPIVVPSRTVRRTPEPVQPAATVAPSALATTITMTAAPLVATERPVVDSQSGNAPRAGEDAAAARARAMADAVAGVVSTPPSPAVSVDARPESAARAAAGESTAPPMPPVRAAVAVDEPEPKLEVNKDRFAWPVAGGTLVRRYGVVDGEQHDGIDILAPVGSPVLAVDAGVVLHAGELPGYGLIVLVRHADGLITLYAHNQRNLVRAGQKVRRGEPVATLGGSGRTSGPHLHLEVRKERLPRNPLFFLKPPVVAAASSAP